MADKYVDTKIRWYIRRLVSPHQTSSIAASIKGVQWLILS